MKEALHKQKTSGQAASVITSIIVAAISSAISGGISAIPMNEYLQALSPLVAVPMGNLIARIAAKAPQDLILYIFTSSLHLYSQGQESEADRIGMQYMQKAGYDPNAAITIIQKLSKERNKGNF
jgi:predicted Zn-dependent protease